MGANDKVEASFHPSPLVWRSKQSWAVGADYRINDRQHDAFHSGRGPHSDQCDYEFVGAPNA